MILDEVLSETAVMESFNEAQEEYVVDAYTAGYITALESYIDSIEEDHKALPIDVVNKIKARAKERLDKAREALQKSKRGREITGSDASETKEGNRFNNAHRHLMNVNFQISRMRKNHAMAS